VTTSTYGLGRGFNEELMVAMARAGHGNSYYGQTAEDLMDPFREELELLNALCAWRDWTGVAVCAASKAERIAATNPWVAAVGQASFRNSPRRKTR
jgi:hypothetical protein